MVYSGTTREIQLKIRDEVFIRVTEDLLEFDDAEIEALREEGITCVMDLPALKESEISELVSIIPKSGMN